MPDARSPFQLSITETRRGIVIRYRLPRRVAWVARHRVAIVRANAAGYVLAGFGLLLFIGSLYMEPTPADDPGSIETIMWTGVFFMVFGLCAGFVVTMFMWYATSMPMLRRTTAAPTSADVRIAIESGWVRILDYRLRDKVEMRVPRLEVSGLEVVAGVGGTELGALTMYFKQSDPVHLLMRAPLPELREITDRIADELGMVTPDLKAFADDDGGDDPIEEAYEAGLS